MFKGGVSKNSNVRVVNWPIQNLIKLCIWRGVRYISVGRIGYLCDGSVLITCIQCAVRCNNIGQSKDCCEDASLVA